MKTFPKIAAACIVAAAGIATVVALAFAGSGPVPAQADQAAKANARVNKEYVFRAPVDEEEAEELAGLVLDLADNTASLDEELVGKYQYKAAD